MDTSQMLLAAPFALLALLALPIGGLRRFVLSWLSRVGHLTTLGGVAACALFAFHPHLAPQALRAWLAPQGAPALAWLVRAAVLVAVALPLLAHLDYARELSHHAAYLRARRRHGAGPTGPDSDKQPQ